MGYSTTASLKNIGLYSYVCGYYIYIPCDMLVYFMKYTPWLYSNLVRFSFIFLVYDLYSIVTILVDLYTQ